jgi:hypothetical protein
MANLPLPDRSQPLDVSYIYDMASVVNKLSEEVSPATYKYVTVDTLTNGTQNIKASEAKMIGGYTDVILNTNVNGGTDEANFSYAFPADFKYAPIAVATPINLGGTEAGKNVSVILKSITTGKVDGVVKFNKSGDVSIGVNLIIIGIPR